MKDRVYPEYCVAIRTLGKAGKKYQQELDSLKRQTIQAKRILVYIPDGYDIPKESIGREEYIRCPKGMMTQRSLPFDEVDAEWILFLDDDIYLPEDGVEKLFDGVIEMNGDCIAPATYQHAKASIFQKLVYLCIFQTLPHWRREWAFRVRLDGGNSYNWNPKSDVLLSQSAPGTCSLCRKSAYLAVNMKAERWIDRFGYALGEDLIFHNKLYRYGYRLLIHFNSGIKHLDSQSSHLKSRESMNLTSRTLRFVNWWRIVYSTRSSIVGKIWCSLLFALRTIFSTICHIAFAIAKRRLFYLTNVVRGVWEGWKYVHSEEYKSYPTFLADRKI